MTIGGITLRIDLGQCHAHKLERIKRGVSFGWYTADPDVLFLSLPCYTLASLHGKPHWPIPDPLRSHDLTESLADEPDGQTDGTPTVVNKRKYTASSTLASVSLPSSGSPPVPSSPVLEVDREANIPGERWLLRRAQPKRRRVDLAPSEGGGVTSSSVLARRALVSPPVFRRRPPTPFNHLQGGTRGPGDQAEGSGYVEGDGNDEVEAGGSSSATPSNLSSDDSFGG